MNPLSLIEKIFISGTYAEERIFRGIDVENMLNKWNQTGMRIAFAEEGLGYPEEARKSKVAPGRPIICEFGEVSCFLLRNA